LICELKSKLIFNISYQELSKLVFNNKFLEGRGGGCDGTTTTSRCRHGGSLVARRCIDEVDEFQSHREISDDGCSG